jgi:uncharacterized metal-binding protein YceD (DUF177 family)
LARLDEGVYDPRDLDLSETLREAILLDVSMNPTCADEPACSERTEALLREVNRSWEEASQRRDPRWAALARKLSSQEID